MKLYTLFRGAGGCGVRLWLSNSFLHYITQGRAAVRARAAVRVHRRAFWTRTLKIHRWIWQFSVRMAVQSPCSLHSLHR